MKKFRVQVKETFICYLDVEANDRDEAYDIVDKQVEDCDVIASRDWDDMDRDISVIRELSDTDKAVA